MTFCTSSTISKQLSEDFINSSSPLERSDGINASNYILSAAIGFQDPDALYNSQFFSLTADTITQGAASFKVSPAAALLDNTAEYSFSNGTHRTINNTANHQSPAILRAEKSFSETCAGSIER